MVSSKEVLVISHDVAAKDIGVKKYPISYRVLKG